jgi:tetratricopeptide (TPR) repeat protein
VYKGTGDDAQALAHFRDALVYRPNSARALNGVGTVLRRQGQLEEAARVFERVLVLQPSLHLAHQNLGNVRRELGQPAAAERHYRTALRYEPRAFHAHLNLAELLRQQGRASEALEHDRAAVALKPGSPRALRGQAESAWALSDFEALVPLLARLLEFDPQDAESGRRLERARAELGSAKEGSAP